MNALRSRSSKPRNCQRTKGISSVSLLISRWMRSNLPRSSSAFRCARKSPIVFACARHAVLPIVLTFRHLLSAAESLSSSGRIANQFGADFEERPTGAQSLSSFSSLPPPNRPCVARRWFATLGPLFSAFFIYQIRIDATVNDVSKNLCQAQLSAGPRPSRLNPAGCGG